MKTATIHQVTVATGVAAMGLALVATIVQDVTGLVAAITGLVVALTGLRRLQKTPKSGEITTEETPE